VTQEAPSGQTDEVPFSDDFGDLPSGAPVSGAAPDFGFGFADHAGESAPGFAPPNTAASTAGLEFEAPAPVEGGGSFDFGAPPAPAAPAPIVGGFDFSAPPAAAASPHDDLAFDFGAPAPTSPAPSFGEVDFGGTKSGPDDLEFDPTAAPKPSADDTMEADLSAVLPPRSSTSQGPSDGLEMLSFIDDTAKDAGAPGMQAPVRRFHIKRRSGKVFGPFEEAVIGKMLEEAQLLGNEEVSLDAENWQPIGSEPSFQAVIAQLMEAPGRAGTQAAVPQVEDAPKGPSMEKLKQLYEGRMASVAVVETSAPVPFVKRLPLIGAGVMVASVIGAGVFAGVATPYGWFFLKKVFPARVKADTREAAYLAQARAGFLKDTFKAYVTSRDLANQALAVKEYPEARAVWNQAVYSLQRKYRGAAPGEVQRADGALSNIELLGEKHVEVLKARAGSALVSNDAEAARGLVDEALAREENKDDLELLFLRAEAFLLKRSIGEANTVYGQILAKNPKSARALHAQATLLRQKNEIEPSIQKYEAALAADDDHVASGIELAELFLVAKSDKAKGEAVVTKLLTPEKRTHMAPAELGKALALRAETLVVEQQLSEALPIFEEALKADPKNAFTQGRMARALTVLNQPEKALPLFRDAALAAPDNLEYTEGYLSSLILLGKMDEASKVMQGANARFPGNAMLSYLSGRVADALDDSKSAEDGYKRAIAADPTITDAHLFLSRLYVRFRRYADALPVLEQGLEKDKKNAALLVGLGELAFYEREFDRAEESFQQASEFNNHSSEAYRGLSLVALEKGNSELALLHIEKALEINPRLQGGRLQKGKALWKLQRLPEAVQELEKARDEEPRNTQVIVTLGAVEFEQGQLSNALNHLLSALQAEPSHPDANFYMARVKNASRDHSQAVEAIKRALEFDGKNPVYRYWYGRILSDAKRNEEAIVEFKQAIVLNPKYVDALETLGRIYVERNQLKAAVDVFNKALAVDPGRNTARAATGDAYTKLQDWDGAIKAYSAAIEADPENPKLVYVYSKLASAYQEKGPKQYQKSVEWYFKATKIEPQNGEAFKNLGYLLKDLKKRKEAATAWKEYLKVTTDDEKTKKVVEDDLDDLIAEGK
jgi:tetratricopeptide (TPR) repeat protein